MSLISNTGLRSTRIKPEWNEYLLRLVEKGKSPAGNRTVTLLNHYMTEKSILVMIDPRPTIVPGEPGLLLEDSIVIHWNRPLKKRLSKSIFMCSRKELRFLLIPIEHLVTRI
jgi:hypothetical protein